MTDSLYHPRPERWPQLSLKGFFVLVTILAIWLGVQTKWVRDRHAALQWAAGSSGYTAAPWSIRLFEKGVAEILVPLKTDQAKIIELERLFPEAKIFLVAHENEIGTGSGPEAAKGSTTLITHYRKDRHGDQTSP